MEESPAMPIRILGISAYYHDSAAALIADGIVMAAAQEERFTRKKHDAGFPGNAVDYCLKQAGIMLADIDYVVYYEKPLVTFERLLETYLAYAPRGLRSFLASMPVWLKDKLYLKMQLKKDLALLGCCKVKELPPLLFSEHHQSHAASAFFPGPFQRSAVLCMDGVGEWAATSVWLGDGNTLVPYWQLDFPHSLGMLYSAFTYYCGFKVNSGEYKLMGLAPYGEPRYSKTILDNLLDLKQDGTFRLNMRYFDFATGLTMTSRHFHELFGGPPRTAESPLTQREMDMARSIQDVTEEVVLRLGRTIHRELGTDELCMAGGVALNCVANGRLLREGPFRDIWIQPAARNAGGALGAALAVWQQYLGPLRQAVGEDTMSGAFLGPSFSNNLVCEYLDSVQAVYRQTTDDDLYDTVADLLEQGQIVGWFQGRMEFGPRALGGRSILGDARNANMQSQMNLKIKYRESFRPFAPSVLEEDVSRYFQLDRPSPYMLLVADVNKDQRISTTAVEDQLFGIDKLNVLRSVIPAVTHVDYSARGQMVRESTNPLFQRLLGAFKIRHWFRLSGHSLFPVRGEPIVCTPEDAYRCFMRTEIDCLVLENVLLNKCDQPVWHRNSDLRQEFAPD